MAGEIATSDLAVEYEHAAAPGGNRLLPMTNEYLLPGVDYTQRPHATIITPHDIDDPSFALNNTLGMLHNAARGANPVEVVVGVNGAWGRHINDEHIKYEDLVKYLTADTMFPKYRLQVRLFRTYVADRSMNRVFFGRCLRRVVAESFDKQRPLDYPILRFDSDANFIKKGSVPAMAEAIRNGSGHLVKIPTLFGYRRDMRQGVSSQSVYDRIARFYGIVKDTIEEDLEPYEERTYHEESGSGAQLQAWARFLMDMYDKDPGCISDEGENKLFLAFATRQLDPDTPPFVYLPSSEASHGTSYRRMAKLAMEHPAWQIPLQEDGEAYQTYVAMQSNGTPERRVRPTIEDLATMVGVMLLRQEALIGREIKVTREQSDYMKRILLGCFPRGYGQRHRLHRNWIGDARGLAEARLSGLAISAA